MWRLSRRNILLWALHLCALAPALAHGIFNLRSRGIGVPRDELSERAGDRRLQASSWSPCAKSWLGYQCTQLVCGRIRMHWSLGGYPPSGPGCSYPQNNTQVGEPDAAAQLLHIALQTDLTGYLALSWPRKVGEMYPADAVIGFQDGSGKPSVAAYRVQDCCSPRDVVQDGSVAITNTSLEVKSTALTICFTRNLTQIGPEAGINITPQESVGMNFAASHSAFGSAHSLLPQYLCGVGLTFYQPVGGPDDGGWRPSNVSSGDVGDVMAERLTYMRAHGALQFTGWIVLVPIGILAARHRWLFASASVVGLWFQVHRAVQMVAVVLVVAGFVLPWTSFDSNDEQAVLGEEHEERMTSDTLLESHETLAIALMVVLGLHIIVAVLRPKPDAPRRWMWNLAHWWTGRGLAALAGINVAIGIALWRRVSGGSGAEWVVPLVLFGAGWVGLAVWLERRAPEGLGRDGSGPAAAGIGLTAGYAASSPSPVPSPTGGVPLSRLSGLQTQISNGVEYTKI